MARYKVLKSVAHNLAHSFTSTMNYVGDDYVMWKLIQGYVYPRAAAGPSVRPVWVASCAGAKPSA